MSAVNEPSTGEDTLMSLQSLNLKKIGVEVRLRADNQFGVFATNHLPAGFVIHCVRPTFLFKTASRYTIQVNLFVKSLVVFYRPTVNID